MRRWRGEYNIAIVVAHPHNKSRKKCPFQVLLPTTLGLLSRQGSPSDCCHALISSQWRGCRFQGRKFGFFSHPCFLDCRGLGKEELYSVTYLVQSFGNGSFLTFIDVQLNCCQLCVYLYFQNKYPAVLSSRRNVTSTRTRFKNNTIIFNPQLAPCSPQGFDDGWNFFVDCRVFLKNSETLPNQKLSNPTQRDLVRLKL